MPHIRLPLSTLSAQGRLLRQVVHVRCLISIDPYSCAQHDCAGLPCVTDQQLVTDGFRNECFWQFVDVILQAKKIHPPILMKSPLID